MHIKTIQEIAKKYKVFEKENGFYELKIKDNPTATIITLEPSYIDFYIQAELESITRHFDEDKKIDHTISLKVSKLQIGYSGISALAENEIFVIDGQDLRHMPLTQIIIKSVEKYNEEIEIIEINDKFTLNKKHDIFSLLNEQHSERYNNNFIGHSRIAYYPSEIKWKLKGSLYFCAGLPQNILDLIIENSKFNRDLSISLMGCVGALSSSFKYDSARDIIIKSETSMNATIESISIIDMYTEKNKEKEPEYINELSKTIKKIDLILNRLEVISSIAMKLKFILTSVTWLILAILVVVIIKN